LEFESANPTVVKSIKQRDLLNSWLRLYAREQLIPRIEQYQPARLAEELPDMVYYTVDTALNPPRRTPMATPARGNISTNISGPGWCPW
jgi:hypothetical protein